MNAILSVVEEKDKYVVKFDMNGKTTVLEDASVSKKGKKEKEILRGLDKGLSKILNQITHEDVLYITLKDKNVYNILEEFKTKDSSLNLYLQKVDYLLNNMTGRYKITLE